MSVSDLLILEGRSFLPLEEMPPAECNTALITQNNKGINFPVFTLTLKDDDLFLITDILGNIYGIGCFDQDIKDSMGLFCQDTRFLSSLELQIDGMIPILLSSTAEKGFALSVLCTNPLLENEVQAETIGIKREIVINRGLFEDLEVTNYNPYPVKITLSLSFAADFADLFEVRGYKRPKRGQFFQFIPPDLPEEFSPPQTEIILAYRGLDGVFLESRLSFDTYPPDQIQGHTVLWHLTLLPRETVKLSYHVSLFVDNRNLADGKAPTNLMQAKAAKNLDQENWYGQITRIRTDDKVINRVIKRAEQDIYLLRQTFAGKTVLCAGVPWFSTLFGRDALIASSQTLLLNPRLARDTLLVLAEYQGREDNPWRDEEAGKILHEIRLGEIARCQEIPHTPYYGTVDATPLWLMLYAEYYAWSHDKKTLESLWPNALAAMAWIDRQLEATGYLCYDCRSERGLVNQGWKDSGNCIVNGRGEIAQGAIALSEVQAYVYAAKIRLAELAQVRNLPDLAQRWAMEAKALRIRFNRDFWLPELDYYALALDGEGKPVDSVTSNPGQCLGLGLLDEERALRVAARLQAPDMFNGWGIRTLSSSSLAYNPMGYHLGSVWPHDNSLIALGLRSLGLVDQALELAESFLAVTVTQPYQRPPELFCGYERGSHSSPVQYPVACSPQAWASGTLFQLLRMVLNLVPDAPANYLRIIEPTLLGSIHHLSITNLQVGQTVLDLEFERVGETTSCRVLKKRGNLRVMIEV